jgi:hypothetical protein
MSLRLMEQGFSQIFVPALSRLQEKTDVVAPLCNNTRYSTARPLFYGCVLVFFQAVAPEHLFLPGQKPIPLLLLRLIPLCACLPLPEPPLLNLD